MSTLRVAADELVDVTLTVNGTQATISVPARTTLADALREHLGLTGTHLGCEHGVCGMCTVLVDGDAARSCLLFAPQVDGSEITTVEGLGTPDELHPLQRSFAEHHALQCGFCTPGFLMSSYDLLAHSPRIEEADLGEQLSGVLCRCTGYRNIVAAVGATAARYRDGSLPAPGNCGRHTLIGQSASSQPASEPEAMAETVPADVVLPQGEPTFTVTVANELTCGASAAWSVLDDIEAMAGCLPGAELTEDLGDDRYAGRAKVALGPIRLSFNGIAQVVERDTERNQLVVLAQGSDAGGGRTQARIQLLVRPSANGCRLEAVAAVYLTGKIAQFGRSLAGDVSRRMFEQFATSVEHRALHPGQSVRGPKQPSPVRLVVSAILRRLRRR